MSHANFSNPYINYVLIEITSALMLEQPIFPFDSPPQLVGPSCTLIIHIPITQTLVFSLTQLRSNLLCLEFFEPINARQDVNSHQTQQGCLRSRQYWETVTAVNVAATCESSTELENPPHGVLTGLSKMAMPSLTFGCNPDLFSNLDLRQPKPRHCNFLTSSLDPKAQLSQKQPSALGQLTSPSRVS